MGRIGLQEPGFGSVGLPCRTMVEREAIVATLVEDRTALAFREFFRNPLAVGSAFPASHFLVDAMLGPVDWSRMERVIEYGPGTGIFTRALLDRLPGHARLLAIDTSQAFIGHLRGEMRDRRLVAVTGSADGVLEILAAQGWYRAACILSGLPFSTLAPERAERLMEASPCALRPAGKFPAYQMRDRKSTRLNSNH